MPRYAIGAGLLDNNYEITLFGKFAHKHDPILEQAGTQWLMHYHLSAPQGPGPAFWHELVMSRFRGGCEFTTDEIATQIATSLNLPKVKNWQKGLRAPQQPFFWALI